MDFICKLFLAFANRAKSFDGCSGRFGLYTTAESAFMKVSFEIEAKNPDLSRVFSEQWLKDLSWEIGPIPYTSIWNASKWCKAMGSERANSIPNRGVARYQTGHADAVGPKRWWASICKICAIADTASGA